MRRPLAARKAIRPSASKYLRRSNGDDFDAHFPCGLWPTVDTISWRAIVLQAQ